ncbi:MAG: hypothetical protein QME94_01770 [Anaerolineae bacterium]|nr:hypothetical protein [Anaerolineae bacterium]
MEGGFPRVPDGWDARQGQPLPEAARGACRVHVSTLIDDGLPTLSYWTSDSCEIDAARSAPRAAGGVPIYYDE